MKTLKIAVAIWVAGLFLCPGIQTAQAQEAAPEFCLSQEDCSDGYYCNSPPRCGEAAFATCLGTCEATTPGDVGDACNQFRDCMEGLVCCYPCGVPDCENVCSIPCPYGSPGCVDGCYLHL